MAPQPEEASKPLLDSDEGVKRAKITVGTVFGVPCFNAILNRIGCEN